MLYLGKNITAAADALQPITEEQLLEQIVRPADDLKTLTERLRTIRTIDVKRYAALKRSLPYFVGSTFNPALRHTNNFAYCFYFVLDIDHISEKGFNREQLRQAFVADTRVLLCYTSPSQDGLKLLFRLSERCYDAGIFSLFYRVFAQQFAQQYHIEQVVDSSTCDVTRASFICYDPTAYHNLLADEIDLNTFVNLSDSTALFDQKRAAEHASTQNSTPTEPIDKDPNADNLQKIKEILGLYRAQRERPTVYVPDELNSVIEKLCTSLASVGMVVADVTDIQYGKQIKVSFGNKRAECNLFYGKRGFRTVPSTRTGTDRELNATLQELICAFLSKP